MAWSSVSRSTAMGVLGAATLVVPAVLFAASFDDGFGDSGLAFGIVGFVWISGLLALMVLPACRWAFTDERVPAAHISGMVAGLAAVHLVAFVGVETTGSNVFLLAYPVVPWITAALVRSAADRSARP